MLMPNGILKLVAAINTEILHQELHRKDRAVLFQMNQMIDVVMIEVLVMQIRQAGLFYAVLDLIIRMVLGV